MRRAVLNRLQWIMILALVAGSSVSRAADDYVIEPTQAKHWAWKKPARSPVPNVKDTAWARNPIDRFILAKLEAASLRPAPPASREQLLRRVTFDLIGLPPTPAEIDAFVEDPAPNAYEKVIDRLLQSPQYGERWGRHWLDLARYAESNGYEHDEIRPNAWRYRDYVIQSFNADKPYDRFVKEQLAGDELYPDDPAAVVATAFNLLGPDMTDASDAAQRRLNTLNDMTDTAGLAFLGLTIGCARCHDHKFEPIPQADYYRLEAFFAPAQFRHDLPTTTPEQRARFEQANQAYQELIQPFRDEMARLEEPYRRELFEKRLAKLPEEAQVAFRTPEAQRTAAQKELVEKTARLVKVADTAIVRAMTASDRDRYQQLQDQIRAFENRKPAPLPMTLGLHDNAAVSAKTFVLKAGSLSNPDEEVHPGFPIILVADHHAVSARITARSNSTGRRTALANWVASPENSLTARVLVNRLWQHHFGRGLVRTASDFGIRGERPTHPELLDWLAIEFVARGWNLKAMHKLMLLSATYQQSAQPARGALARDPDNHLYSRMNLLRLEGEVIRDSLLAIGGRLNTRMGGPSTYPPIPREAVRGSRDWAVSPDPQDHVRRSVYILARRNLRFPFLESFDLPDSNASCPRRERSTTAPQALTLLNDADVVEAAQAFADRVAAQATTEDGRITLAYRLALGRRPSASELRLAREFLTQSPFCELCRGLLNVNEFVYLD
jgi:hypothetical protein